MRVRQVVGRALQVVGSQRIRMNINIRWRSCQNCYCYSYHHHLYCCRFLYFIIQSVPLSDLKYFFLIATNFEFLIIIIFVVRVWWSLWLYFDVFKIRLRRSHFVYLIYYLILLFLDLLLGLKVYFLTSQNYLNYF